MWVKQGVLVLCLFVLVLGCAGSAKRINDLDIGMTKSKVIEIMGEPNYTSATNNVEILTYRLKSACCFSDNYFVKMKDGKVDRFGQQGSFGTYY